MTINNEDAYKCGIMKKQLFAAVLLLFLPAASVARSEPSGLQQSQIESNVPTVDSFDAVLRRDLLTYFQNSLTPEATSVNYQLLRKVPTQSGLANPKYYVWVNVLKGASVQLEGAVRLAAVEKQGFDVTHFFSKKEILEEPTKIGRIFPAALVPLITELAAK